MDGAFPSSLGEGGGDEERHRGFRGTQENAKTKLCLRWKSGHCRFGDSCNFAHGEQEIRQLPPRGGFQGNSRGRGNYVGYGDPGFGGYPGGHQMDQRYYDQGHGGRGRGMGGPPSQGHSVRGPYNDPRPQDGRQNPMNEEIWAEQGFPVPGPNGWTQYTTRDTREQYYHNAMTNETVWDKPLEWQ